MEEITSESIRKIHPYSYRGIFYSYDWKEIKTSYPFWITLFLTISLIVISAFSEKDSFFIVSFWISQFLTIFPSLLGFNLGGYALIIGFGNADLVQSLTKILKNRNTSIFQKLSGIFAYAILLQLFAFCLAFLGNFLIQLKFTSTNLLMCNIINYTFTFFLSFVGLWGILILPSLVVNVFNFGQMHHFKLTQKRLKEEGKTIVK